MTPAHERLAAALADRYRLEAAQDQLESLFALPVGNPLSAPLLRLDPVWAPLREHPRFRRLTEGE